MSVLRLCWGTFSKIRYREFKYSMRSFLLLTASLCWLPAPALELPKRLVIARRIFVASVAVPIVASATPSEFNKIDGEKPFLTLESGVRFKEFKEGQGEEARKGSKVSLQCSGRLLNLNGVYFYNTK